MLKKMFTAAAFCLTVGFVASAQEVSSDIKPAAGEVTGEVQLNLTTGNTVGLGLNQLRGRYFLSQDLAVRTSLILDIQNESGDNDFSRTATLIVLSPGIEKHFAGTDRLSPYVGAEITLAKLFANQEDESVEIEGAWSNGGGNLNNRNYFGLGLGAVAGADYYFAKHVYLGVEFGFGLQYQSEGDVEVNPTTGSSTTIDGEGSAFRIRPSVNSGLRLGFVF